MHACRAHIRVQRSLLNSEACILQSAPTATPTSGSCRRPHALYTTRAGTRHGVKFTLLYRTANLGMDLGAHNATLEYLSHRGTLGCVSLHRLTAALWAPLAHEGK
jgi:hypothetical protein